MGIPWLYGGEGCLRPWLYGGDAFIGLYGGDALPWLYGGDAFVHGFMVVMALRWWMPSSMVYGGDAFIHGFTVVMPSSMALWW